MFTNKYIPIIIIIVLCCTMAVSSYIMRPKHIKFHIPVLIHTVHHQVTEEVPVIYEVPIPFYRYPPQESKILGKPPLPFKRLKEQPKERERPAFHPDHKYAPMEKYEPADSFSYVQMLV